MLPMIKISDKLLITCMFLFGLIGCISPHYETQVVIDSDKIEKRVIYQSVIRGGVGKIQISKYRPSPETEITILGQTGIHFLSSKSYELIDYHHFKDNNGNTIWFGLRPELLDIEDDGKYEIMKGGGGFGEVGLLDREGNKLWAFEPREKLSPIKMISGDLNNDNQFEFYVADYDALFRLDVSGDVVWKVENTESKLNLPRYDDVGIFTDNKLKQKFILTLSDNTFYVYDFSANKLRQFKAYYGFHNFEILEWNNKEFILVGYYDDNVSLFDLEGNKEFEFKLDNFPLYHSPQAIAVKFRPNEKEYLVILAHSRSADYLTQLNIVSPEGKIIYQEIIKGTSGLASLYRPENKSEVLIIGDGSIRILEYRIR